MHQVKSLAYRLLALGAVVAIPASSFAYTGQRLSNKANVTLDQARSIALKARPGTITDQELENERGGSGLRYSFDVKSHKVIYEVGVDAETGKLLENAKEGQNPD